jgi:hypothetical protein
MKIVILRKIKSKLVDYLKGTMEVAYVAERN